jgi:hypothetical protein
MEKLIALASYWLGLICVVLSLLFRVFATFGIALAYTPANGLAISYNSFFHGAIVFLLLSGASSLLSASRSERP